MKHLQIFSEDGAPEVIGWFDDFHGPQPFQALSNFYVGDYIYIPGVEDTFATGEHAFAAMKAFRGRQTHDYRKIRDSKDPGTAKLLGRKCRLRSDWEAVKYDVMMAILRAKFDLDREEGDVLLETGDALLIEGTYWEDRVWGVALQPDERPLAAPGRNWLGTMLMARRAELRAEVRFGHSHPTGKCNGLFVSTAF